MIAFTLPFIYLLSCFIIYICLYFTNFDYLRFFCIVMPIAHYMRYTVMLIVMVIKVIILFCFHLHA